MVLMANGAPGPGAGDVMVRRVLSTVLISAALSAYASCSAAVAQTSAGPAPNAASIIANNLGRHPKMDFTGTVPTQLIFQANKRVDQVEMSDLLRQIRTGLYGLAWQTCIRANVEGRQHTYAVFVEGDRVVDSRMALALDQCDQGHYTPLPVVRPELPKPAEAKPANAKPTNGKPTNGKTSNGKPA
jgi:hypothetical protein